MTGTLKRKALILAMALVMVCAICLGAVGIIRPDAGAEGDYGTITVHKHDGAMLGITIDGVQSKGPAVGQNDFAASQDKGFSGQQFAPFFTNLYFNGMPIFNWAFAPGGVERLASGQYLLGGYTYLIGIPVAAGYFQPGDVVYLKKGFQAIYRNVDSASIANADQALSETVLQYDRYFVYDGNEFLPANVLQEVTASADTVAVGSTVTLTPEFLPISFTYYSQGYYGGWWKEDSSTPFYSMPQDVALDAWDYAEDPTTWQYWGSQLSKEMVYTSSDDSIATVTADGVVTGHKAGWVTITATHVDSNEKTTVRLLVRGSATDATAPTLSVTDGSLVITTGVAGSEAAALTVEGTAFALIEKNGAPLFGADATVAVTAEGVVSTGVAVAEGDLIRLKAGWQAITSADGTTASVADAALAKDSYYRYDGETFQAVTPFTLGESELSLEVRTEKALTVNFAEGVTDQELIWTSSADYMVSVENGTIQTKNYVTGGTNKWAANAYAPTDAATFPDSVTITATHPGTGAQASVTVTVTETIEEMTVEVSLTSSASVGFKFIGKDSGRMVTSDYMTDVQRQMVLLNPGHANTGMAWDRNLDFFTQLFLNDQDLTNSTFPGAVAYPSTNLGISKDHSVVISTNGPALAEGSVVVVYAGTRPFAYQHDYGYFYDSMRLEDTQYYQLKDGDFVHVSPLTFGSSTYTVKAGNTVATSVNTIVDGWNDWYQSIFGINKTVTYEIADTNIATVDASGVVTGVAPGTTTLTAKDTYGFTFTTEISVQEKTTVALPEDMTVEYGKEVIIELDTNNPAADFVWSMDTEGLLSLNIGDDYAIGTTLDVGKVVLTVSVEGESSDTMTITIIPDLSVFIPANSMEVGTTMQLSATTNPDSCVITYTSSDESIATVDSTGLITAAADKTGKTTITVTAVKEGSEEIKAVEEFELKVFTPTYFNFSKVETAGAMPLFYYDGALMAMVATEGMQSVLYLEENKDALPDFFQKILINEPGVGELTLADYWWQEHQLQIHVKNERIEFYWFDMGTNSDGSWDWTWTSAAPEDGTIVTFEAGCRPVWGDRWGNYYSEYELAETARFIYQNGKWQLLLEEGAPFTVVNMGKVENNEFMITFNSITTTAMRGEVMDGTDLILFNGYTVNEINAANEKGVQIYLLDTTMSFSLDPDVVMDGVKIFDGQTDLIITIKEGFTLPTSYVCAADYVKQYYPEVSWWAPVENIPVSDEILTIKQVLRRDEGENKAFVVVFGNENKVFKNVDSAAAGIGAVHVNAMPEWFSLTQWYNQLDDIISSGTKQAVWDGIYINDRSVREIMFDSGASTIELQSIIVAVHFSYTDNAIRFVLDSRCDTINGVDWEQPVTLRFDADVFHTDTGAHFDKDVTYVYDPNTNTWSEQVIEYVYEVTVDEAATVEVGKTVTLNANVTVTPADGDKTLTWTSSDETVATVVDGVVTGVKAGTATITVTAVDGTSATCTVTVTAEEASEPGDTSDDDGTRGCQGCGSSATGGVLTGVFGLLTLAGIALLKKKRA